MSNVDGIIGGGIVLSLTNSGATLQAILGLMTCTPPNTTAATVDSTDQSSGNVDEFIVSRINPGEMTGTIKYVPGNPDDLLFKEHLISREKRAVQLDNPSAAPIATQRLAGVGAVTAYTPNDGSIDGIRTSSFTIKISGLPTEGDAT